MKCGRVSGRFSRSLSMLSAKAVQSPRWTPMNDSSRAKEWARGRKRRCTLPSAILVVWAADSRAEMWLPCVCTTPLGGPVVPEVYTMVATSSGAVSATRAASSVLSASPRSRPTRRSASQVNRRGEGSLPS